MSRFRRIEIIEPSHPSLFLHESSIFTPKTLAFPFPSLCYDNHRDFSHDFLNSSLDCFDTITDLIQLETLPILYKKKIHHRISSTGLGTELYLQSLCDRVSALESSYDRLVKEKLKNKVDRKYTWTAEIKDGEERKYKWTVEINAKKKKEKGEKKRDGKSELKKSCKWTAEIKKKGDERFPVVRTYTFEAGDRDDGSESSGSEKKKKMEKKKKEKETRTVEIEEEEVADHGAFVLRQAFAKRDNGKGKKKELSRLDAANLIQRSFRAYIIRRSQVLRALRELAIAKTKLKELRELFHNFAYRRHVDRDAEERQRFSEKIIVLLLTVDAIEGADLMVRSAKRSMIDELEAMLEVVDPQPVSKSLSMRRRTFDMPSGGIQKEIAAGVAKVVQMLDQEENGGTFEACL